MNSIATNIDALSMLAEACENAGDANLSIYITSAPSKSQVVSGSKQMVFIQEDGQHENPYYRAKRTLPDYREFVLASPMQSPPQDEAVSKSKRGRPKELMFIIDKHCMFFENSSMAEMLKKKSETRETIKKRNTRGDS